MLPYQELYDYDGAAAFVADYVTYQPLQEPVELVGTGIYLAVCVCVCVRVCVCVCACVYACAHVCTSTSTNQPLCLTSFLPAPAHHPLFPNTGS